MYFTSIVAVSRTVTCTDERHTRIDDIILFVFLLTYVGFFLYLNSTFELSATYPPCIGVKIHLNLTNTAQLFRACSAGLPASPRRNTKPLRAGSYISSSNWSCGSRRLSLVLILLNILLSSSMTECRSVVQGTSTRTWTQRKRGLTQC